MTKRGFALFFPCALALAQIPVTQEQARELRALVAASPRLPLTRQDLPVRTPSAGWSMDMVSSVAVDRSGLVYAFQRGAAADPVVVLDQRGRVLRSFGAGLYKIPHGIRVDPNGNIWTVDAATSLVVQHSPDGKLLSKIEPGGTPANHRSEFRGATDLCFAPNGHIYIADGYANARVLEYTMDGRKVREWGRHGTGDGEFYVVHGITVDRDGTLFVADRENGRIQRFDPTGRHLGTWSHLGKTFSITLNAAGELWIGTQPRTSPNGKDGWLMKIDKRTGRILGYVESPGTHSVDLIGGSQPITGARPDDVVWFRPAR